MTEKSGTPHTWVTQSSQTHHSIDAQYEQLPQLPSMA
jgi:hypothetical protein